MKISLRIYKIVFVVTLLIILASCSAKKDPTIFYSFDHKQTDPTSTQKSLNISVGLVSITIPRLIDRPQIITRKFKNKIVRAQYHQWGGDIKEEIEATVINELSHQLNTSKIFAYPKQGSTRPLYELNLNFHRLDGSLGEKVFLGLNWHLESTSRPKSITSRQIRINSTAPGSDYASYIAALQKLLITATEHMANDIRLLHSSIVN